MAFPEVNDIAEAVVEYLKKRGNAATNDEVAESLARKFRLTSADLAERTTHSSRPGGESSWKQRLRRAKYMLVVQGRVASGTSAKRGVWELVRS